MKIWFKIWENTHLLKSETIEDDTEDTRTHKIFHALEEVCLKWDLGKPIWFEIAPHFLVSSSYYGLKIG